MMIAQPAQITMKFEHEMLPEAKAAQVTANSQRVTVAYYNMHGIVIKAFDVCIADNPELANIAQYSYFGDIWDMEMVADLIDLTSPEEPANELALLIPAYLESIGVSY